MIIGLNIIMFSIPNFSSFGSVDFALLFSILEDLCLLFLVSFFIIIRCFILFLDLLLCFLVWLFIGFSIRSLIRILLIFLSVSRSFSRAFSTFGYLIQFVAILLLLGLSLVIFIIF
jgi:hypothetical protein